MFRDVPCSEFCRPRKEKGKLSRRTVQPKQVHAVFVLICTKERENDPDILQQRRFYDLYPSIFLFSAS